MAVELGANYILEEPIGQGTFGVVWRGIVRADGQPVAVKMLRPELASDPVVVTRFLRERGILVGLDHPNIVSVADLVAEGGKLGIVMQLVAGGDLRRYLDARGTLAPSHACALLAQVADGLSAAHAAGVVHRDLKPENVLIDSADPEAPVARITDFGIARLADQPSLTNPSQIVGSPAYISPEVASGRAATAASDVYAVGIMAYQLLCGRPPFEAEHPLGLLKLHIEAAPSRLPGAPDRLWRVIATCLAKDPAERPAASSLAHSLQALAGDLAGEQRQPPLPRASGVTTIPPSGDDRQALAPPPRRRRIVLLATAGVAVASVSSIAVAIRFSSHPRAATTPTNADSVRFDFDANPKTDPQGVPVVADTSGKGHRAAVRTEHAGQVSVVAHPGQGNAVKFPSPCSPSPTISCPRAIMQVLSANDLDPGTGDFSYGADLLLMPDEARSLSNVMQKATVTGVSASAGGWRLEVLPDGRPSCVLVAKDSGLMYRATSTGSVGDGAWHRVRCTKAAALLTIDVDSTHGVDQPVAAGANIMSDVPMRLGGTGTQQANGQFFGAMDNVFFHLGE